MRGLLLVVLLAQVPEGRNLSKMATGAMHRTSHTYHVLDPATGGPVLEITQETELSARRYFEKTTTFTVRSGERYVLRHRMTYGPLRFDDSLEFPNAQKIVLTGRHVSKAPDATSTAPRGSGQEGSLHFGDRKMAVDMNGAESAGMFKGKEGREFRVDLPALPDELIDALSSLSRDDLCGELMLCGMAPVFFEAYRDDWMSKEQANGWELKKIR